MNMNKNAVLAVLLGCIIGVPISFGIIHGLNAKIATVRAATHIAQKCIATPPSKICGDAGFVDLYDRMNDLQAQLQSEAHSNTPAEKVFEDEMEFKGISDTIAQAVDQQRQAGYDFDGDDVSFNRRAIPQPTSPAATPAKK